jgi:glyoxylase-like metal-dependent hydrolase (beta-lactamase superfamily II)
MTVPITVMSVPEEAIPEVIPDVIPDVASDRTKLPRSVPQVDLESAIVFAFPPNREILGGTAYCILNPEGNVLIDCPAWNPALENWLRDRGGVRYLVLTHRGGIAKVKEIQAATGCEVVIQEQEAYLLPNLTVTTFHQHHRLTPEIEILWTAGHSPGSSCVYTSIQGGLLFTGRHLLPDRTGSPAPLRISKTFHWKRQLNSIQFLRDRFTAETLSWICPGASTGYLRGATAMGEAYPKLLQLDLAALQDTDPGL